MYDEILKSNISYQDVLFKYAKKHIIVSGKYKRA